MGELGLMGYMAPSRTPLWEVMVGEDGVWEEEGKCRLGELHM